MTQRKSGQQYAIAALRKKNKELALENSLLWSIIQISDMQQFAHLINNVQNYFGDVFDRLSYISKLLTSIVWDCYPDSSFIDFADTVELFSPELAAIFHNHGITFAIIAPKEHPPAISQSWQLATFGESQGFEESQVQLRSLRVYTLELFNDALEGGVEESTITNLYSAHKQDLENAVSEFCDNLLLEVTTELQTTYGLTVEKLTELVNKIEMGSKNV